MSNQPNKKSKKELLQEIVLKADKIFDLLIQQKRQAITDETEPSGTLLTTRELCEKLRISRPTLYRLRKQGLPSIQVGTKVLFNYKAVKTFLNKNKKQ